MSLLVVWTIFDHPNDYPDRVVVRGAWITPIGPVPRNRCALFDTVDEAREELRGLGLFCVGRAPDDPPAIVESWF